MGTSETVGSMQKLLHRGLEREDLSCLMEAYAWMSGIADRDCDCHWLKEHSQRDNPCDVCQARRARDSIDKVIDPKPRTLHPDRLVNQAELVYYELWCKENERVQCVNGGYTLMEHLLCPSDKKKNPITHRSQPDPVSQHDMEVATTVIQWLGTNCGRAFIAKAEAEIERRRAQRVEFNSNGLGSTPESWKESAERGPLYQLAESIADQFISKEKLRSVHSCLISAITSAFLKVREEARSSPT